MTELVLNGWFLQGGYNEPQLRSISGGVTGKIDRRPFSLGDLSLLYFCLE